ncbi:Uu.00g115820.m01.CDS01 [Anthostomella pinea]|uniref:Uu.00g115820.m01.CDS01 n=1 Tax=Anthostomella pinea TaxID=933095 RepID=A0AAI8VFY7_9PEZI|nr:Uu.00g115820.m01.CDS01 [Anthostomella pinea]
MTSLLRLPDELLEGIVQHLGPRDTVAFGITCKRIHRVATASLVWRRHCIETWRYWQRRHKLAEKTKLPPAQTDWRQLFKERAIIDRDALALFDKMLTEQQSRSHRMEEIASQGYDVKDLLLRLQNETLDSAEDVLARRYHAAAILGQIHRLIALDKWTMLQQGHPVKLEEALGAYDLFVTSGQKGDLDDIARELDVIAQRVRDTDPEFENLSIRQRAVKVAELLRSEELVGNPRVDDYHALRNNFISIALFDEVHTSLPLQSVSIYCAVAQRLDVNAKPSNFPQHVHAVIEALPDQTLDGVSATPTSEAPPEVMYMDPWNSSDEVPEDQLSARLSQMGVPLGLQGHLLGAASTMEMVTRTGRNIMNSVEQARHRPRLANRPAYPDNDSAWYSILWSMLVLGDSEPAAAVHHRRQVLPYLVEHFQTHFPNDIALIERIPPMFTQGREHQLMTELVASARHVDYGVKTVCPRNHDTQVQHKVGHYFKHRRYGYEGFVVGWDTHCAAEPAWIEQMRVDDLPRGRDQPFYNIVADDKSVRYVAEENIQVIHEMPSLALMQLAGRYFKRWDEEKMMFESNIRDQYPDD